MKLVIEDKIMSTSQEENLGEDDRISFGTRLENSVVVPSSGDSPVFSPLSRYVDKKHCEIYMVSETVMIRNYSERGVLVNGQKVMDRKRINPRHEVFLALGGKYEYRLVFRE